MMYDLVVIGGGAAGFFGAIQAAEQKKNARILILEKTTKLLSKVKISGGGRCNVTHHCLQPAPLSKHYPRGQKVLKQLFQQFHAGHTIQWFADRGVLLKVEEDGRMFPQSDDSQTIIDCFLSEARKFKIEVRTSSEVISIDRKDKSIEVVTGNESFSAERVLVAMGGHPQTHAYEWLQKRGHSLVPLLPSLFTFNDPSRQYTDLMGVSVPNGKVKIASTDFEQEGPILITHWGLSGPAVIKLSAWAAVYLHACKYTCTVLVNWVNEKEDIVRQRLLQEKLTHGKRVILNYPLFQLPSRLWERLLHQAEIAPTLTWLDCPHKNINRLTEFLVRTPFSVKGKTTYKEEFVTCGGIDWQDINPATMESKILPGVYFAGEVINIDGETGGFNFQAAWTTATIAAHSMFKP